ncbi:hypothetical protein [Photobacterium carnosum]|uniref:Uncharacterized protein n=1 Tax=Photobacterium carnosum TaxID=2023717 RepID=A0A2N4UNV1_9GAMM|nr:hypothetical protein [Photobacterium carnosum]MCD9531314.1 hypothetical protein [Photobacterium carnosum]MCF2155168.1 hypothetical protein [Photobacterium carnosum]MCF2217040.1 hypothetical protein [Photobacterium carnosum]PLC56685.1 hypothetical protein CIK00_17170 [Photobacterium carnosum]
MAAFYYPNNNVHIFIKITAKRCSLPTPSRAEQKQQQIIDIKRKIIVQLFELFALQTIAKVTW